MKSSVFWDMILCSLVQVNRSFRRTYHFHLWGQRVWQASKQHEAGSSQAGFLLSLLQISLLSPEYITQMTELFMVTAVGTPNPTTLNGCEDLNWTDLVQNWVKRHYQHWAFWFYQQNWLQVIKWKPYQHSPLTMAP
jgi:hypothetical protein